MARLVAIHGDLHAPATRGDAAVDAFLLVERTHPLDCLVHETHRGAVRHIAAVSQHVQPHLLCAALHRACAQV